MDFSSAGSGAWLITGAGSLAEGFAGGHSRFKAALPRGLLDTTGFSLISFVPSLVYAPDGALSLSTRSLPLTLDRFSVTSAKLDLQLQCLGSQDFSLREQS